MESETKRWWQLDAGMVTGVLALIFSLYSIVVANRQFADTEGSALINETYATYQGINARRMDTVEISHLVCGDREYPAVVALVREATSAATPAERAQMKLREQAMAMYLFAQFEQTVYLHQAAVAIDEQERIAFSKGTLDYFTGTLFRNPRLAHLWSEGGANLRRHYDAVAQRYWDEHVGKQPPATDAAGPFGSV
jgi:hypothetical protein